LIAGASHSGVSDDFVPSTLKTRFHIVSLVLLVSDHVWGGEPGATPRVILPMTLAFNLTLLKGRAFWPWWLAGNLAVIPGVLALLS
jgi:hypothetical protein